MYSIAIVDDDIIFRERLRTRINCLKHSLSIQAVYLYDDLTVFQSDEAFINTDILFMNVKIPNENDLRRIRAIQRMNPKIQVIVVSSLDAFMKGASGINVYGYLLKEKMDRMLETTIRSAIQVIEECDNVIIIKTRNDKVVLKQSQIRLIVYEDRHPVVYAGKARYTVMNQTLKNLESKLSSAMFIRANHGTIVNLKYLHQLNNRELHLKGYDEPIVIARGRYSQIVAKLMTYREHIK